MLAQPYDFLKKVQGLKEREIIQPEQQRGKRLNRGTGVLLKISLLLVLSEFQKQR